MFSASFIFSKSTVHGTEFSIEKINLDHTVALTDCARRNNFEYPKHFEKEVYTELHIKNYLFREEPGTKEPVQVLGNINRYRSGDLIIETVWWG